MSLTTAYSTCKQSMSPTSNYMALMHGTLGTFYKTIDKPQESIEMLQKAVDHVGGYFHISLTKFINKNRFAIAKHRINKCLKIVGTIS